MNTTTPCPKCGNAEFDVYSHEDTRYCLKCGQDSFVIEGDALLCARPETGSGGWYVPDGIAAELLNGQSMLMGRPIRMVEPMPPQGTSE